MTVQSTNTIWAPKRDFSCLSVGDPVTDIVAQVSKKTLEGIVGGEIGGCALVDSTQLAQLRNKIVLEASDTQELPGGSAANVAACIASLSPDATCQYALALPLQPGSIGADATGTSYTAQLQTAAVEPHFVTAEAQPSAVSVCLVTPDGQRTMRTCLGAARSYEKEHLPSALMQSMQLIHCEGYTAYKPGVIEGVAEASKAAGATFSLDMASFEVIRNCWTSLQGIIESGRIEVLFCNEDEASAIVSQYGLQDTTKQDSLEDMIQCASSVLSQHCRVVVFTLGAKGAVAVSSGRTARCSAAKVSVVDTVGAGDAFCGAFLAAYMQGADLQACVEVGCASGAEAVQSHGARLPASSIQRLRHKLDMFAVSS